MLKPFVSRRWLDFRNGHGIYLTFVMTFVNFILIAYNLGLERIPFVSGSIGGNVIIFALIFVGIYIPAALALGYWHRRNQYVTENEVYMQENPINAWLSLYHIRHIKGIATQEETDRILKYCEDILRRHHKEHLMRYD